MAKKSSGPNKSQAIRDYYSANPDAKPRQVVDALKEQGVEVSAQFVSTIRSKQLSAPEKKSGRGVGRPKKTARKSVGRPSGRRVGRPPAAAETSKAGLANVSAADLFKAKEMVNELGGLANARATLDALDQLND